MIFTLLRLVCSTSICTATYQLPNLSGMVVATNAHVYEYPVGIFFQSSYINNLFCFSSHLWLGQAYVELQTYRLQEMNLNFNLPVGVIEYNLHFVL